MAHEILNIAVKKEGRASMCKRYLRKMRMDETFFLSLNMKRTLLFVCTGNNKNVKRTHRFFFYIRIIHTGTIAETKINNNNKKRKKETRNILNKDDRCRYITFYTLNACKSYQL